MAPEQVFGADAKVHPITGMRLENGVGALPDDLQALVLHCAYIEQTQGEEAAAAMRDKVRAFMAGEQYGHEHPNRSLQ